ncbi:hypothetical protein [Dyella mobilis]|uniref:Kazal-like domain-containing protein n=1 Tax=Dyella mobilis TaxID=1849582 RepID=A0ABS2KKR5_9GAMM|nr:hypothetical protein [Dyella mobilis]MBM7131488.1 hypothetical protein [Dyella mobilis]
MKLVSTSSMAVALFGAGALLVSSASCAAMPTCPQLCPTWNQECTQLHEAASCNLYNNLCTHCIGDSIGSRTPPMKHDVKINIAWVNPHQAALAV